MRVLGQTDGRMGRWEETAQIGQKIETTDRSQRDQRSGRGQRTDQAGRHTGVRLRRRYWDLIEDVTMDRD